jgi:hypothetical protein
MVSSLEWWRVFLAGVSTLAIFSFLIRENQFYRFFEHLFIGIATAIGISASIRYFLWPELFQPLLGLDRVPLADGSLPPYNYKLLLYLIPMAFGLLYYAILSPRYAWLAQIVIGFSLGIAGGSAFQAVFNELIPQLYNSFRPLYVVGDLQSSFDNIIFSVVLISVMSYFFFTFKRSRGGELLSGTGKWMMMICFGAFFGSTIMARMALLVERLEFLINKWLPLFFS